MLGKKKGKKKEKRKRKEVVCGWWGKKKGRGYTTETGEREEENAKGMYFGNCEKKKEKKRILEEIIKNE